MKENIELCQQNSTSPKPNETPPIEKNLTDTMPSIESELESGVKGQRIRQCRVCLEYKESMEFSVVKRETKKGIKLGFRPHCKICWAKSDKEYRKQYRIDNKDKITANSQKRTVEQLKRYELTRKEKANACPEHGIWKNAKQRAKKNGLEFNIEVSDIIIPDVCPILGIPLFKSDNPWFCDNSPTLDKINNDMGYVKGNIKVVSWKGNALKRDATVAQLKMVIKYMEDNLE